MKIGYEIKGLKKLNDKFNQLKIQSLEAQLKSVQEGTLLIHETAVKLVNDNSDGRSQLRYNPKRVVNASDPGDPPNTDTGRLVKSILFDFKDKGLIGRVGSNLKYAAFLEFGTMTMEPRPWLSTAVQMSADVIGKIFAKNISEVIKGSES